MAVLFVILLFAVCLGIEFAQKTCKRTSPKTCAGAMYTTPGFEYLGALAQDGGERLTNDKEDGKHPRG